MIPLALHLMLQGFRFLSNSILNQAVLPLGFQRVNQFTFHTMPDILLFYNPSNFIKHFPLHLNSSQVITLNSMRKIHLFDDCSSIANFVTPPYLCYTLTVRKKVFGFKLHSI